MTGIERILTNEAACNRLDYTPLVRLDALKRAICQSVLLHFFEVDVGDVVIGG